MLISIKEYLGVVYDGIILSLILNINDNIYNFVYWFDKETFTLKCDDNFLFDLSIEKLEDYENYENFINFIEQHINKNDLIANILDNEETKRYHELIYINNMLNTLDNLIDTF